MAAQMRPGQKTVQCKGFPVQRYINTPPANHAMSWHHKGHTSQHLAQMGRTPHSGRPTEAIDFFEQLDVAIRSSVHARYPALHGICSSPLIEQQADHRNVAVCSRSNERCHAFIVRGLYSGTPVEQQADCLGVAFLSSEHERCPAVIALCLYSGTSIEQQADCLGVAFPSSDQQLR
jgi:hypothetical protein